MQNVFTQTEGKICTLRQIRHLAFALLIACASGTADLRAAAQFTAALDRDSVIVGEAVSLTLKFEGGAPRGLPAIPPIPGLQIQNVSQSASTSIVNGQVTSAQMYTLTLVPQQPGTFTIPALSAEVEGQKLTSQPVTLKVLQNDPSTPPPEFADKLAFLWLVVPRKEVFVGEVFLVEMRLYWRGQISNAQIPPLSGEGFTASKFVEGQRFQRAVGSVPFMVVPLQIALTPIKTGTLPVGPLSGSLVVHLPLQNRRRDIFDFFGPQTEPHKVDLSVEAQTINVLPLPSQNIPPGFAGAVGTYTMSLSAGPTNVAAGDPVTVKMQISGKGQLDALTISEQTAWRDFKVYPPTARVETQHPLGIQGTKFFEQIVVPQSPDIKELPPVSFSFFDPEKKSYVTLTQPAVPLLVRPGGSSPAPTIISAAKGDQDAPTAKDIVHIKPRLGMVGQIAPPLIQQPWFLGLQLLPAGAVVAVMLWRKRADNLANNPRLRRQRQVAQIMRDGFAQLRQFAAENKSDEFFATLWRLLQEQLGERLDLPASAITEAVIEERLRPRGVPDSTLVPLQELFHSCNIARYAPVKSSQELAALITKFEVVVRDLQALK
jgi:hypothetical protein